MDTGKVLENFTPGPCELQKKMAFKLASETPNFVASSLLKIMMLQPTEALSQIREHTSLTGAILKAAVSCERCYANLTPNVGPVSLVNCPLALRIIDSALEGENYFLPPESE